MRKKIVIFIIIFIISVGGIFMFQLWRQANINSDLGAYAENLLDVQWKEYIEDATGEILTDEEEYALLKLKVKEGCEQEIIDILYTRCGKSIDVSSFVMPGYKEHIYAMELKELDILYIFTIAMDGKKVKTRSVTIYIANDDRNQMYIYVFG